MMPSFRTRSRATWASGSMPATMARRSWPTRSRSGRRPNQRSARHRSEGPWLGHSTSRASVASIEELLAEDLKKRSGGTRAEWRRALREKRKIRSGETEKKLAALLKNATPEIRAAADLLA